MSTPAPGLLPRLEDAAGRPGATVTFLEGDDAVTVERSRLHDDARRAAADLQSLGIGPGAHVAFLGATSRALVTAIEAVWLAGATVVVLPLPMRLGSIEEFVAQTRARIRRAEVSLLLADPDLLDFMEPEPDDPDVVLLPDLGARRSPDDHERPVDDPEALAVLQFTSGSTAEPKGVALPHRCVAANLDGIARAARLDPEQDVLVSWLPLYHDMGLIGTLTLPLTTGTDLVLAGPQDFMAAPRRWVEWMSRFRGTATAGPNFAYALAARALRRAERLDLSPWRIALNGAEPVDPATVEAFCEAGARHGLDPGAVFPAFGIAEATLAVTFPEPGSGMRLDVVDDRVLETDRYAAPTDPDADGVRRLPRLGRPLHNLEVRICDPETGSTLSDREVGELEIRGESVTPGYQGLPRSGSAAFHDGWFRSGDLAYLTEGELVVCGRIKDMIIVGGRNVFPEDAERAAAEAPGVRPGNVIAFGSSAPRGERLVVVAETKADPADTSEVRDAVARRVRDTLGLPAREIVLVRPGSLPKTSSGKLQRSLCRARYHEARLDTVDLP